MSYCEDYPCCGHTPSDPCSGGSVMTASEWTDTYYCDFCGFAHGGDCYDEDWDDEG